MQVSFCFTKSNYMRQLVITNSITSRDQKSLQRYLNDISKHGVLTPDEELELFKRYKNGDEQAFNEILTHNLRFVVSVAKKYQHSGMWLGDLINEGNIGLIKAAMKFDETKGFKFISYAVWWIRQSILQALNDRGRNIRMPINQISARNKIRDARTTILQTEERVATLEELSEMTGMTEEAIERCEKYYARCSSLDAPLNSDSETTLADLMEDRRSRKPDFAVAVRESQRQEVRHLLSQLKPKEAEVVSRYYGIGRKYPATLNDIGDSMGMSRERIRQIKDKGVQKLRRRYGASFEATFAN